MAEKQISLEQYLLNRGLMEPDREIDTEILEKPDLLDSAASAWITSKEGIRLVVRARMMKLRKELIFDAEPVEVPELRRAVCELAALLDDFERYAEESKRRTEETNSKEE